MGKIDIQYIYNKFEEETDMKVAIVGSRGLNIDISRFIPSEVTEIISGGAKGIDISAEQYADSHFIPKRIIRPDYSRYGRAAPLKRNEQIVEAADIIIAFWDGQSKGTKYTIQYARKIGKPIKVFMSESN